MNTDELIGLLAADARAGVPLGQRVARALACAVAVSALLLATIGPREDLAAALGTARVQFKFGFTLLLAATACAVVFRVGVPAPRLGTRARLLIAPLSLLLAGIIAELAVVPPGAWETGLVGRNAAFCLFFIPVLAVAPLAALLWALRFGAPDSPGLAGAAAGLAAGGLAAALYALHCADDSPLFVACWYGIAITITTVAGWLIGRRLLRW